MITGETGTGKEMVARAHPQRLAAQEQAVRGARLRRDPARSHRVDAVRSREGLVHRRGRAAPGLLRAGPGRHHLPRRDRRAATSTCSRSSCASSRTASSSASAATRPSRSTCACSRPRNRDLRADGQRRHLPRRSLLPPLGDRVELPPLRERREDIPQLVHHFLRRGRGRAAASPCRSRRRDGRRCQSHDWPGNVRELRNVDRARRLAVCGPDAHAPGPSFGRESSSLPGDRGRRWRADAAPAPARWRRPPRNRPLDPLTPGLDFKEAKQRVVDAFETRLPARLARAPRRQHHALRARGRAHALPPARAAEAPRPDRRQGIARDHRRAYARR